MSAHNPTILELTSCPRERAVSALLALLRGDDYLAQLRVWPSEGPELRGAGGAISFVEGHDISVSVEFPPDPDDASRTCPTIEIDGRAYKIVYDPIRDFTNPEGKSALIKLCLDVAEAAQPEVFRLRFIEPPKAPLSVQSLVEAVRSSEGTPGLIFGIAATSPSWLAVQDQYEWERRGGYQFVALI